MISGGWHTNQGEKVCNNVSLLKERKLLNLQLCTAFQNDQFNKGRLDWRPSVILLYNKIQTEKVSGAYVGLCNTTMP